MPETLVVGILGAYATACTVLAISLAMQTRKLRARYSGITDVEDHIQGCKKQALQEEDALASLKAQVRVFEERNEDLSYGLYDPHFSFATPEQYKLELEAIRDKQRQCAKEGSAVVCEVKWTVGNDRREGTRMVKGTMKMMLRAFNGECDAALANVSWNNINRLIERVTRVHEDINKLAGPLSINITERYLSLRLCELRLSHEYEERKHLDREEQRRIREQIREEERTSREIEQAKTEAETDELKFTKAIEKARLEAQEAVGAKLAKLTEQIVRFEAKLDEARARKEKAISRAQLTKSGFVYVISNIGSFGEQVFKIGMTRRLEPMDRIYELSGASVPFPFDLHAMLWSDDAPTLEHALHQHFAGRRLNLVNPRREFYRDVSLAEVEAFVHERGLSAQFIATAEAREYRESVFRRNGGQARS